MTSLRIVSSAVIPAPPDVVYDLMADYRQGHPSILPPEYFEDLTVEAGGRGEDTRIRFVMKAFGQRQASVADITEPEPGRVLVETVRDSGIVTSFTVTPTVDGHAHVELETRYPLRGLRGWFERLVVPGYLRKVYEAELGLLRTRATEKAQGTD